MKGKTRKLLRIGTPEAHYEIARRYAGRRDKHLLGGGYNPDAVGIGERAEARAARRKARC